MTRRGWLLKVKNDGKMLTGRVKTGDKIENDGLDIIQPAGLCAHVKPDKDGKTEILTMDVGADTSRRVIMSVFENRENHPKQPDENEVFLYAPGEKEGKMHLRIKRKKDDKKDGDGQQSRADGEDKDSSGNKDSGRPTGMHWDALKEKVSGQTEDTFQNNADKGQGFSTKEGSLDIKAGKNTQFEAKKHLRKGEHHLDGKSYVSGDVHANDHFAGGGTTIQSMMGRADSGSGGGGSDDKPDGSKEWQANGREGKVSLLQTAAQVGNLQGMMGQLQGMLNQFMQSQGSQNEQQQQQNEQQQETNDQQQQTNQQTSDQIQQLLDRITTLEEQVAELQGP